MSVQRLADPPDYFGTGLARHDVIVLRRLSDDGPPAPATSTLRVSTAYQASGTTNQLNLCGFDRALLLIAKAWSISTATVTMRMRFYESAGGAAHILGMSSVNGSTAVLVPDLIQLRSANANMVLPIRDIPAPLVDFQFQCDTLVNAARSVKLQVKVIPWCKAGAR